MGKLSVVAVALIVCIYAADSAKILGVFHIPSFSHYHLSSTLMMELARRGHEVTVINPYPQKTPMENYTDIDVSDLVTQFKHNKQMFYEDQTNINFILLTIYLNFYLTLGTRHVFEAESVKQLLKSDKKFDLVIIEELGSPSFKGFAYHYNAPCIIFTSTGASRWVNHQVGNPANPSYIPDVDLPYQGTMSFMERLHNTIVYIFIQLYDQIHVLPTHNKILQENFPGAPDVRELHYNVSLTFVNAHESTHQPVPYVPNMINIGGFHVKPPKQLPKHLKEFLDGAKEGVVLFSMGSIFSSAYMSEERRNEFQRVFAKLNETVLCKWDDEPSGKPPNVRAEKWFPQNDVLAHPNIKLFITHGGLLSTTEAIYHGIPVVGIPYYADQKINMANAVHHGLGLVVPYFELTESKLFSAIQEVLTNPKHRESAQRLSNILLDQPIKPLEKAIYWTEYVLRHKGAPHLRVSSVTLAWYQYLLLDVVLFMFAVTVAVALLFYIFIRKCVFCKRTAHTEKKTN